MKLYNVVEATLNQDGSEDSRSVGIFDNEEKANEACEKMERSVMYTMDSKRFYVCTKQLNEIDVHAYIPKEGLLKLKMCYGYIGSMAATPEEKNDPNHYVVNYEWFLDKTTTTPVEKISSHCAVAYIAIIAGESSKDFRQRKVAKFHEMWEEVNKIRRESGLVTIPFEMY